MSTNKAKKHASEEVAKELMSSVITKLLDEYKKDDIILNISEGSMDRFNDLKAFIRAIIQEILVMIEQETELKTLEAKTMAYEIFESLLTNLAKIEDPCDCAEVLSKICPCYDEDKDKTIDNFKLNTSDSTLSKSIKAEQVYAENSIYEQIGLNLLERLINGPRFIQRYTGTEEKIAVCDIIEDLLEMVAGESSLTITLEKPIPKDSMAYVKETNTCSEYEGIEVIANLFVEDILEASTERVSKFANVVFERNKMNSSGNIHVDYFDKFNGWPTIEQFTVEFGTETIYEYIETWQCKENWLYSVDFVMGQSDECSDYYLYDAKWTIPTRQYPIPQAIASVYFKIEVSRVIPQTCAVNVTYIFEGSSLVHTPFRYEFQEQWLFDIIHSKLKLFKSIKF